MIAQDEVKRRRNAILGDEGTRTQALKGRDKSLFLCRPFRAWGLPHIVPGVALSLHPRLSYPVPLGQTSEYTFLDCYKRS